MNWSYGRPTVTLLLLAACCTFYSTPTAAYPATLLADITPSVPDIQLAAKMSVKSSPEFNATQRNPRSQVSGSARGTQAPSWWQSGYFRASCSLVLLFCIWWIYRRGRKILAARRVELRMAASFAERVALARELHDTLLQTLQASSAVADDAVENSADADRVRGAARRLSEWLSRALDEGRAVVFAMRQSTSETSDLGLSFQLAAEEACAGRHIETALKVIGVPRPLCPMVRHEVYRIGFEAIRNACQHSMASGVEISLRYGKNFDVLVIDNGVGMDPLVLRHGKDRHFGLQGMAERARRIESRLCIESTRGAGTAVRLQVPGEIIYSDEAGQPANARQNRAVFRRGLFSPARRDFRNRMPSPGDY